MSRPLHQAYLESAMAKHAFLPRGAGSVVDRKASVQDASARRIDPSLLDEIATQQAKLPLAEARQDHLRALREPGTVVVATGQQVGLFLGPLYTLYKAASAIAWAKLLERELGVRAVPLFWLQTEDHDFAEIASITSPCAGDAPSMRMTLAGDTETRTAIADRVIGDDVHTLHATLELALTGEPNAGQVRALLARHYVAGARVADAFAGVLAEIFPELVIFNPRNPVAAKLARPVIDRSFARAAHLDQALIDRGRELEAAGFTQQIQVRPGSSLAFLHDGDAHGPRQRLLRRGEHFRWPTGGAAWTLDELAAIADPMRFSTSALLRPIVQDTLLPVALYVGGPAEVDYFGQVNALYPLFDRPPPLIAMRSRFRLTTPRLRAVLDACALTPADLDRSDDELAAKLTKSVAVPVGDWQRSLDAEIAAIAQADPSLARVAAKAQARIERAHGNLRRRYDRALLERDQVLQKRVAKLRRWLRPDGAPQERVHGFMAFAARAGVAELAAALREHADPLHPALKDIAL